MRHRVRRFSDAVFLYADRFDGYKVNLSTMVFSVAELREGDLLKAAELSFVDYKDTIQSACAVR